MNTRSSPRWVAAFTLLNRELEWAIALQEPPIDGLVAGHDLVDEVVVLVDEKVDGMPAVLRYIQDVVQDRVRGIVELDRLPQPIPVGSGERPRLDLNVLLQARRDGIDVGPRIDPRKIPPEDEVLVATGRGVTADVQATEQRLEVGLFSQVVVAGQRVEPQRLAEPPRPKEHQDVAQGFDPTNEGGPIDIGHAIGADPLKVGQPVGKLESHHEALRRTRLTRLSP